MKDKRFNRRFVDAVTMFIVTALSFMLLVYVGYGEGRRTYEQFHVEKLVGHGSVVQNAMENYLRAGLPLDQYAGFTALAEPIVKIQDIDALAVYDQTGRQLFLVADKAQPQLKLPEPSGAIKNVTDKIEFDYGSTHYQVILPLRTRFETVGSLVVTSPTDIVTKHLDKGFQWVLYPLVGLSLAFAIAVFIASPYMARVRTPWLQIGYAVIFLTMAGVVVGTLISLYAEGVQSKTKAAAVTLSQRLNDIVEFNLRLREFDGLERTFSDYKRLNPDISEAALINEGVVQIATDPAKVGKPWTSESRAYEHFVELTPPNAARRIVIAVAVPKDIIYKQIESSVRNFAALFVASGFMAGLFLQVASSMQRLRFSGDRDQSALGGATALIIVKPIFFLAVFLEHLTYSFLPKFMQDAALASGMSAAFASAPFTAYYLCFALSLIPAGHFADRYGPRPVIWGGMVLASATLFSLIFPLGILPITAIRGLSGIGQGMLFIGIQSYILAVASPEKKTQGAAIIVFGFQGGMISGMAIGSLLVTYLQPEGVFVISGAIGAAMAVYSLMLIPREIVAAPSERGLGMTLHQVASDLKEVIHSGEFLRTMFCIGVPAKAILTGTITFALPLLLGQQGYRHEEIGQILMLYGIGVVAASAYISRLVDRTGNTEAVLFWGAALSGVGLVLIGLMGSNVVGNGLLSTSAVVAGVVLVGIAHGFINAPVIAHVAQLELAGRIGVNPVTTTYRFLERIGHVAGPFLVGQLFLIWGQSPHIIGWIGIATATLGLLFIVHNNPPRVGEMGPEAAR